jgi:2,3-diaminopropionate biosynthesis protein SbnB
MGDGDVLVIGGEEVRELLTGREGEVLAAVREAYVAHAAGESSLPHSSFLRFPGRDVERIIALPAFLGGEGAVAGLKWVSSFPANVAHGMARASAVLLLNSCATGRLEAILESSLISAARTAASAAEAARLLLAGEVPACIGLIGAGVISREIARYLRAVFPAASHFLVHDLDAGRAAHGAAAVRRIAPGARAEVAASVEEVLAHCELTAFATTAVRPHVADLAGCPPGAVILHVSLRDLTPQAILACDNVVDDPDHVCRAQTSVHLAEQLTGSRDFIRCTLGDIYRGTAPARRDGRAVAVFSPFGLGILDLAVGRLVRDLALARGGGLELRSFHPVAEP